MRATRALAPTVVVVALASRCGDATGPPPGTVAGDFAIVDAQFTQGVQATDGSIPLVAGGGAAAVNILIRSSTATATPMQVVLRLFDASHALVRADTATVAGPFGTSPSYAAPSVQFRLPAAALVSGVSWQVERDPRHLVSDDSSANDVFPRTGPVSLSLVAVPPLHVRLVPIVLSSNGNATGDVTAGNLPEYIRTVLSVHPVGALTATIGPPFTTAASFGTGTSGGDTPFWGQVLSELDLARLADTTDPSAHWFGVVAPPPGFTFAVSGGIGYIPASYAGTGAGTRTSAGVEVGWFARPTQARDNVAHELGHNFGRRHSPCGGAPSPDLAYPYPGGSIGVPGTDVYDWSTGAAATAAPVSASTGDLMSYCFPLWSSDWTYKAVLQFRGTTAASPPAAATRVLVVRGSVSSAGIALEPALTIDARPTRPELAGPYRLEGLAQDGRVLFAYDFTPAEVDHAPVGHFAFAIPQALADVSELASVRVRGPAGEARLTGAAAAPSPAVRATGPAATALRATGGMVTATCADTSALGIAIFDDATGRLLGTVRGFRMSVAAAGGTAVRVACSDGIHTALARLGAR